MIQTTLGVAAALAACAAAFAAEGVTAASGKEAVRVERFIFKKTPQGELAVHVSYPPGWKATDKRPGVVFFFGGAWVKGSVRHFAPQAEYVARRGMVAARADYRIGNRHGTTVDKCVEDAKSAVRWFRANAAKLGADPKRIVASGGSAGGHLAIACFTTKGLDAKSDDATVSCKPNLLVLFNPVLDLSSGQMAERVGSAEIARRISPIHHLTKDVPPAILFYGATDRFFAHGKEFVERSAKLKTSAELYYADRQGHGFFNRPPWQQRTIHLMDRFLVKHKYLSGKATIQLPEGKVAMKRYEAAGR